MKTITLKKLPNQSFYFSLDNKRYTVELNSRNGKTYLSYSINKQLKLSNRICLDRTAIDGLFMFEDIEGNENPYYDGFNQRFKLRLLA